MSDHPFHDFECQKCGVYAKYCLCDKPQLTNEQWDVVRLWNEARKEKQQHER